MRITSTQDAPKALRPGSMPKITGSFESWTYSKWRDYADCPYYAALKHLMKLDEGGDRKALERGEAIHNEAHAYIHGRERKLPPSLKFFRTKFELARTNPSAVPELKWGFSKSWHPVEFFSKSAWLRTVLDLSFMPPIKKNTFVVVDYKTGKVPVKDTDRVMYQLEVYAMSALLVEGKVETVNAELWYLDHGKVIDAVFHRKNLRALQQTWTKRIAPMFKDTLFAPDPSAKCQWCRFSKSFGGPCRY